MTVFHIRDLGLSYQGIPVFANVSATLGAGDRIGIVGPNGCGKTSLLRAILGIVEPDRGSVDWVTRPRIGYVPQKADLNGDASPADLVGYEKAAALAQCGLDRSLWDLPSRSLSGGERTRLLIALALSHNPGLLVMDEPTNHLDIPGMEWLEGLLRGFPGTVLAVSHDRFFLDAIATGIWELRERRLAAYSGRYSAYLKTLGEEQANRAREYAKWQRQVKALTAEVRARRQWYDKAHEDAGQNDFLRRKAKKHARQFKAKETVLERLAERKPELRRPDLDLAPTLSHAGHRTRTILRATHLSFQYHQGKPVLEDTSLSLGPRDKAGLVGPNGSGKTTLVRLLVGELGPTSGSVWTNPNARIGYLSQMLVELDTSKSAARNVAEKTGLRISEARNLLGRMGLRGDTQLQLAGTLSMGERTRMAMACLCFGAYDCLVLDEPTNHLDATARESIEQSLASFPGALVIATHDRYLLDRVCSCIWSVSGGRLRVHRGNYSQYRDRESKVNADPVETDEKALELVLQTDLAYLASRIAAAKEDSKADLEREYAAALSKLKALRDKRA